MLGTIRSRTHHYPFRLVPPEVLLPYLQSLCDQEQVAVEPGVLQLVIRAGGGTERLGSCCIRPGCCGSSRPFEA